MTGLRLTGYGLLARRMTTDCCVYANLHVYLMYMLTFPHFEMDIIFLLLLQSDKMTVLLNQGISLLCVG